MKPPEIVEALKNEGIQVPLRGVYYVIARYKATRSIYDAQRSGHPSVLGSSALLVINNFMKQNDEFTTCDLC